MSAHTPGPWSVDRHGAIVAEIDGQLRQVAMATGEAPQHGDRTVRPQDIQAANADLIAAAPDLLAALEHVASVAHFPEVIAAIAKARGTP